MTRRRVRMEWDDGLHVDACLDGPVDEKTRDAFHAIAIAAMKLEDEIADSHNVVACPKCGAPVGERCVRMSRHHPGWAGREEGPTLKGPHRERWTQVVPER